MLNLISKIIFTQSVKNHTVRSENTSQNLYIEQTQLIIFWAPYYIAITEYVFIKYWAAIACCWTMRKLKKNSHIFKQPRINQAPID